MSERFWDEILTGLRPDSDQPDPISFRDYVRDYNVGGQPPLIEYDHVVNTLVPVCQDIIDGTLKRVIVMMPPRFFKSECFSRLLPACYLMNHPGRRVGLASYGASLAWELSEDARNYFLASGGLVSRDTSAKSRWRVRGDDGQSRGEMWASGVGGPMLGRGYHLGIIDDPQDPSQAHSPTYQKRFAEWYPSKFLSRQEPDASIVVIMQRLGPGDAIEFLFEREMDAPEHWHVVCMDEIKSDEPLWRGTGPMGLPETCTLHDDHREVGEPLSPKRFSLEESRTMQKKAGVYVSNAQRQQRPAKLSGDFWSRDWFQVHDELPFGAHDGGKSWDTAYTKNDRNSASAYVESYRSRGDKNDFTVYIEDVDWNWFEFPELVNWMKSVPGPHYVEAKATGKSAVQTLTREGVTAAEVNLPSADKLARAASVQPLVANGRVSINRRIVERLLTGEHPDPRISGRQGLLSITAESLATDSGDLDVNDAFVQEIHRHISATANNWNSAQPYRTPR